MKSNLKFPVVFVKRIPYFSKLLAGLVFISFTICLIAWYLYFPSTDSGNEMKTVALIENTSESMKWLIIISGFSFLPLYLLYVKLRIRKSAFLLFNDDNIIVQTQNLIRTIPILNIRSIQFHEPNLYSKIWSHKLMVAVELYDQENLSLQIKHYEHANEIVDSFLSYDDLKLRIKESANSMFESDINS